MELEWQLCLYPSGKDCEDEESLLGGTVLVEAKYQVSAIHI